MEICIDIVEVFYESNLVPVAAEQREELFMVHAPKDGALADLEPIEMKDRKDCTRLLGVDVLKAMPGTAIVRTRFRRRGGGKTNVAVGPVSASPSPTMQGTIKLGSSITAPNDTASA